MEVKSATAIRAATTTLIAVAGLLAACGGSDRTASTTTSSALRAGVAAIALTPCGSNPEWDGPITANGVWGELFTDLNGNGRWDPGEPFDNDPVNTTLDFASRLRYDGIYLAGFGKNRIATGCHDDIWARALVLETAERKVAVVSVDMVGEILHGRYYGFARARDMLDPALGLDAIIFSSTHNHQSPDTLGLWGESDFADGKFPRYLQFVDRQIALAISRAAAPDALQPVRVIAAQTTPAAAPALRGLQVRTGCRPPFFFDEELRALQFVADDGATIATLINWSTHPESLEDRNTLVSSDFPHFIRTHVEAALGGTAVYVTGDLGAAEIVGDTCVGGADPRSDDGSNEFDRRDDIGFERTQQLGELVGATVVDMLRAGEQLAVATIDVARADYHVAGSNDAFAFANTIGLLDLDDTRFGLENCPPGTQICPPVEQYLLTLGDAGGSPLVQMVTAPGELFPEIFYGTERHRRTDCPEAHTGLPYEPSIRDAMEAPYRLLIGLSPDEFGYIVPGYDFHPAPSITEEARDPCQGQQYDPQFPRRRVPSHYHESLSVGVDIAATTACYAQRLLGREAEVQANAACRRALWLP
jgi:hypothetical protein